MHDALHDVLSAGYAVLVGICIFVFQRRYDNYHRLQAAKEKSRRDELAAIKSDIADLRSGITREKNSEPENSMDSKHDNSNAGTHPRVRRP